MPDPKRILIAIDDFQRSHRVLDYVAKLADGSDSFEIHLFHAAGPLPPQLLESPGAEGAAEEERVEQRQERQQDLWFEKTRNTIEPQLATAKARLVAAHIPASRIETHLLILNQREDLVAEIIKAARGNRCGAIIVGRNSYSWVREQFHTHVSNSLIDEEETQDLAICVVSESPK